MNTFTRIAHVAALAACAIAASQAQAKSDSDFMKDAAHAGATEVEGSQLALSKAQRADVKSFAQTMITDHTKVADELKKLATTKKVELPEGPSVLQKSKIKLIDAGDNAKFDERYVKTIGVEAHQDTIKLFQEAARDAKDPDVKAWAQKTLPGLQHHLQMAQGLAGK